MLKVRAGYRISHIASEALSARIIAGGEGGDPRLRGEGEVGCGICERKHPALTKHHLTLPLLRNGAPPSPPQAHVNAPTRRRGTLLSSSDHTAGNTAHCR